MSDKRGPLTKKSDGWYTGCGCGQKAADRVEVPAGSMDIFVQKDGELVGPVSGIRYRFHANHTAIDIDARDALVWLSDGTARQPLPGFKGLLTRVE